MNRVRHGLLLTVALLSSLSSLLTMTPQASHAWPAQKIATQGHKLNVVTSITILQDIARNVAGDRITLNTIVPPDGDAHEFEPTPNDIKQIASANLILVNGAGLERFIEKMIKDSGTRATVVTVSAGVPLRLLDQPADAAIKPDLPPGIVGFSGTYQCGAASEGAPDCDPHMWQDPTNVILYTLNIRDALIAADAANADAYRANAALYVARLKQLDTEIWQAVGSIPASNRILVTNHDALGYFVARYGFKLVGVVLPGGGTSSEPGPKDVAALITAIKSQHIPAIFTENISNNKLAAQIAEQAGVKVIQSLYTDALGAAGTPGETYLGMMQSNIKQIAAALSGK